MTTTQSKKLYEDGLPLGVIGLYNFVEITKMQILVPMGQRTKFEVVLLAKDNSIVARREFGSHPAMRTSLASEMHIGLKYTDSVLAATIDYNARFEAAMKHNEKYQSYLMNQFKTEHVTYSIVRHPGQMFADWDKSKDRVEPEFYRAVAQGNELNENEEPELLFDDITDTLFEATVLIRNSIEKALIKAFIPGVI